MARIDIKQSDPANPYGAGELQLQNKVAMSSALTLVTDSANTASQLKLATNLTQVAGTLQIHTDTATYLDAEDASGNNRFTISRDPASQLVTVDFASIPTALTTPVGAIRTATNGSALANVMTFLENGNIGVGTDTPGAKFDVHSAANVIAQFNRTGTGKSWIQYLLAGAAKWNTGFDNVNGNFTIYDAIAAADRMVVSNAGNVGIGTTAPAKKLNIVSDNAQIRISDTTSPTTNYWEFLSAFANTNQDLFISNQVGTALAITSPGNVGIGTTTPGGKFEVSLPEFTNADTNNQQAIFGNGVSSNGVRIGFNNTTGNGYLNSLKPGIAYQNLTIGASNTAFNINATEVARFTSNGLCFNGDTAAANALDDYEEGTFTATLTPSTSGSITLTPSTCSYTKIGKQVTVRGQVVVSAISSPIGGTVILGGLPFTSNSAVSTRGTGAIQYFPSIGGNSLLNNYQLQTSVEWIWILNASTVLAGDEFYMSLTYFV